MALFHVNSSEYDNGYDVGNTEVDASRSTWEFVNREIRNCMRTGLLSTAAWWSGYAMAWYDRDIKAAR